MNQCFVFVILVARLCESARPNVVVIMLDDLGYGDVSYNTGGQGLTPEIDKMSRSDNSIRFDRFYSTSNVCSPTRASVLTGRIATRDCIYKLASGSDYMKRNARNVLSDTVNSFPKAVNEAANDDYKTGFFGKFHLGPFYKSQTKHPEFVSHPGTLGFNTWSATRTAGFTTAIDCSCAPDGDSGLMELRAQCLAEYGGHYRDFGFNREVRWLKQSQGYYCQSYHGVNNVSWNYMHVFEKF